MSKKKEKTLKERLRRLEEIADELDRDDTELETSVALFEEGVALARECGKALDEAELKIVELKGRLDETFEEKEEE
ncbi:MAG: exodeoxyribonuclease VII small subunit [Ignavibacteriales bacterium]|nr:exodeoxyribonuclease VII small subunit [Ignavibacteriales bacterium]